MAIKTKAQLTTDANTKIKDNGGVDTTKTKGIDHRTLTIDMIDSFYSISDRTIFDGRGNIIKFDRNYKFVNLGSPAISNFMLDMTGAIEGNSVLLCHRSSQAPTFSKAVPSQNIVLLPMDNNAIYLPLKLNWYSFQLVEFRNGIWGVVYSLATSTDDININML